MVKVVKAFRDRIDKSIYYIGSDYNGERVVELTEKGFLDGSDQKSELALESDKELTIKELRAALVTAGVEFDPKAKKPELLALVEKHLK